MYPLIIKFSALGALIRYCIIYFAKSKALHDPFYLCNFNKNAPVYF